MTSTWLAAFPAVTSKPLETNYGIVTSWVPITLAYSSQSGCDASFWSLDANTIVAWDPGYGVSVDTALKCWPDAATTWFEQEVGEGDTKTVLSLGQVTCPAAYYTATSSTKDGSSTFLGCCPTGYAFNSIRSPPDIGQCLSQVSAGQVITYVTSDDTGFYFTTSVTASSTTNIHGAQFNGWQFVATSSSSSFSSLPSTGPSTSIGTTPTPTASIPTSSSTSYIGGLSSKARIGIGIGVTLGFLLLAATSIFLLMFTLGRWRHRRQADLVEEAARAQGRARSPPAPPSPLPPAKELVVLPSHRGSPETDLSSGHTSPVGRSGSRRLAMSPVEMAGRKYDVVLEV